MIATSNRNALLEMQSKLKAMGGVIAVIGEPMAVQGSTVAIIPQSARIDETTLTSPREIHEVIFRRYEPMPANATSGDKERIEFAMDAWRAQIQADIFGEFDLGGTIAYPLPLQFEARYGYQEVSRIMCRLLDLTVVYRIDDNATFAP